MKVYEEFRWRGLVHDASEGVEQHLQGAPRTCYVGFDPTADSLHVGSLLPLMTLARMQKAGHRAVALMGGGTGLVGDPSGKNAERKLLALEQAACNLKGIQGQVERFLDLQASANPALLQNNADWLQKVPLMEFLREVGRHFTVNQMMAKESVKRRLAAQEGISFTEFSYMLLQAYDFLVLHDRLGCTLQLGGSDQWGNITAGIELIRRTRAKEAHGLTFPLLTTSSGRKFGKTEKGTVWLDPKRTSPYRFWQFWRNTEDKDVVPWLKALTWLDKKRIAELEQRQREAPEQREAQQALADTITTMVHGEAARARAERAARLLFSEDIIQLKAQEVMEVLWDVPSARLPSGALDPPGLPIVELIREGGLAASKGEARRLLLGGGAYLNNRRLSDPDRLVTRQDAIEGCLLVLRKGKKSYALVHLGPK